MRIVFGILAVTALYAQGILSDWAFGGADHRLHYRPDERGNTIMDFSTAGYRGGGVKVPFVDVCERLTPMAGDNTARIQAALDKAKGAVLLAAGEYEIAGTLSINRSGVVLRGEKGTTIKLTGKPHRFLEIHGAGTWQEDGPRAQILDAYVPAGATSFRIHDTSAFHPGDRVLVLRPVTTEWLHFMGMDTPVTGSIIRTDRVIDSVDGDRVTLDVPLSDALDSHFTSASLVRYSFPGRITEVGVEGLRIIARSEDALGMDAVEDGWVRDVEMQDTQNGIAIGPSAKRVTLANVSITHSAPHSGSRAPADFALSGTQVLVDRCRVMGEGTSPLVTQPEATGPLVVFNFTADHAGVAPHQPWVTGLLVDGGSFPGGTERQPGVAFSGGAVGWSVAWNIRSPFLLVQHPPGALNWCIGCIGTPVTTGSVPNGIFDSPGKMVEPPSLYLHQLRDRLGPEAVRSAGYDLRSSGL